MKIDTIFPKNAHRMTFDAECLDVGVVLAIFERNVLQAPARIRLEYHA